MSFFTAVVIFIVTLFLYIHITNQFKKSQDMEIYEADFVNNQNLQEICDMKQPVVVDLNEIASGIIKHLSIPKFLAIGASYPTIVRDIEDYNNTSECSVDSIALPFKTVLKLFDSDAKSRFFSDLNSEFIEETGIASEMADLDEFLKPPMTVHTKYDIMFGSRKSRTPLRYSTHSRKFIVVSSGKIIVKMTPFKSTKYLHEIRDYENYEFRSEVDVWSPQPRFVNDLERVKFIEFDVLEGSALYIPAYWWYSINYADNNETCLLSYTYSTAVNRLANISDIGIHFMQMQNTVVKTANEHPLHINDKELDDESKVNSDTDDGSSDNISVVKMTPETINNSDVASE